MVEKKSRTRPSLIVGTDMVCPRCKKQHNILAYTRLMEIQEFEHETTPIYKCPSCKWMFAPADQLIAEKFLALLAERGPAESS